MCDSPCCDHEVYECECGKLCDFCKKEELEEKAIEKKFEISNNKRKIDEDEYYADDDSDDEEPEKLPIKKMRFNI